MPYDAASPMMPTFWQIPGGMPQSRSWTASNCALARLLARHRRRLTKAVSMAVAIRQCIDELLPSMRALRRRTCRFCPEPCCITNTVWFDFRDLLVLHLLNAPLPARQAATDPGENCPFLGCSGCQLPWHIRPWMCVKYLCPTQRKILKRKGRPAPAALYGRIEKIETSRSRMESEVLHRIRPKRRTSPSSASACSQ
jgi:hypothetical protein